MATTVDRNAVQEFLDKAALQELVLKYARYVDRLDLEGLRSLYHPDAVEDRGAIYNGSANGFVDLCGQMNHEQTMHRISNMLFVVEGDKAQGEVYIEAYHRTKPPNQRDIMGFGRYLDHYEKRDGVWKIAYRTTTIDRCEARDVDPAWYQEFLVALPAGKPGPDDLSYKVLTMFETR